MNAKAELAALGMWESMHLLDEATTKLGWEAAEIESGKKALLR